MSVASRFDKFIENIKLTDNQKNDAKVKYDGVCKKIHDYYFSFEYNGSTKLLIGSYGKSTNIRPARDVDIIFKLPSYEYKESTTTFNHQSYLLQKIKNVLLEKYPDTKIKGDGPVVSINFSTGHCVELVPAIELESGQFYIPVTQDGGCWKLDDPRALYTFISESDKRTDGNTRNLIRMIKKWQQVCNVPIKSLAIESRCVNFLAKYEHYDKSSVYYDWMVRDFFHELLNYKNGSWKLPGLSEKIYYGDAWYSRAETAYGRAVKACDYETDKDEDQATIEWKKIFGDDFWF